MIADLKKNVSMFSNNRAWDEAFSLLITHFDLFDICDIMPHLNQFNQAESPNRLPELIIDIPEDIDINQLFLRLWSYLLAVRYHMRNETADNLVMRLEEMELFLNHELITTLLQKEEQDSQNTSDSPYKANRHLLYLHIDFLMCMLCVGTGQGLRVITSAEKIEQRLSKIHREKRKRYETLAGMYQALGTAIEGNPDDAIMDFQEILNSPTAEDDPYIRSVAQLNLAEIISRYFISQPTYRERAIELLEEAVSIQNTLADKIGLIDANRIRASIFRHAGKQDQALDLYSEAAEGFKKLGYHTDLAEVKWDIAEMAVTRGDIQRAKHLLKEIADLPHSQLVKGKAAYLGAVIDFIELQQAGKIEYFESLGKLDSAIEIFEDLSYEEGLAKTQLLLANLYLYDVSDTTVDELEDEKGENYLLYVYELQSAARYFIQYNQYEQLLNALFLMGRIYFEKGPQKRAEEVWQLLLLFARYLENQDEIGHTSFSTSYQKRIQKIFSNFTLPDQTDLAGINYLISGSLKEPAMALSIRCMNIADIRDNDPDTFIKNVKLIESAMIEISRAFPDMNYVNNDFVDYYLIFGINDRKNATLFFGLSILLYLIFSQFYTVRFHVSSGASAIEIDTEIGDKYSRYLIDHSGIQRGREVLDSVADGSLCFDQGTEELVSILRHYSKKESGDRQKDIGRYLFARLEALQKKVKSVSRKLDKLILALEEQDSSKDNLISRRIENFVVRYSRILDDSRSILDNAERDNIDTNQRDTIFKNNVQDRLRNDNEYEILREAVEKYSIVFDFEEAIRLNLDLINAKKELRRVFSSNPKDRLPDKDFRAIVKSFATTDNKELRSDLSENSITCDYLCPSCFKSFSYAEAEELLTRECPNCGDKIDGFREIRIDMEREIKDLLALFDSPYDLIHEKIPSLKEYFPFLKTNRYVKNKKSILRNKDRKMSYIPASKKRQSIEDLKKSFEHKANALRLGLK